MTDTRPIGSPVSSTSSSVVLSKKMHPEQLTNEMVQEAMNSYLVETTNEIVEAFTDTDLFLICLDKTEILRCFYRALMSENISEIEHYIRLGINVNVSNRYLMTPLFYTIIYNKFESFNYLLEHGADINATNEFGNTPLIQMILCRNDIRYFETLLARNPLTTVKNNNDKSAFDIAKVYGMYEQLCYLISHTNRQLTSSSDIAVPSKKISTTINHTDSDNKRRCVQLDT
jgi:ankyrin repeat protein